MTNRRAMLGDVEFNVLNDEQVSRSSEITEHAVERGVNTADHIRRKSDSFSIRGVVVGDDASARLNRLILYHEKGELLTYVGRNLRRNLVIESFNTSHSIEVRDGFVFDLTLREVRIAELLTFSMEIAPDPVVQSPPASAQNPITKPPEEKRGQPMLQAGTQGSRVAELQRKLLKLGVGVEPPTGVFSSSTKVAVIKLQERYGLPKTGVMDDRTWWVVNTYG